MGICAFEGVIVISILYRLTSAGKEIPSLAGFPGPSIPNVIPLGIASAVTVHLG